MQYIIILLLFFSTSVLAHKSSDSYLALNIENREIFVRWDIALQDLNNVISLDRNNDGKLQWGELRQDKNKVFAYSFARLDLFSNSSSCEITPLDIKVNQRSDGYYAVLFANALCVDNIDTLNVDYQLFFEVDAQHRGLAKISTKGGDISYAFSPDQSDKLFEIGKSQVGTDQVGTDQVNISHSSDTFFRFLSEGIWHIWIGFDHMLFLISLLLPAVLLRYRKNWIGIKNFSSALSEVIKVVTAFTVAHSLTLSLVMFEQISLPVMFVESIIAFSVIVVALNNLYPLLSQKRWLLGLFFGLIHGFGFANVLSELELGSNALFMTMLGFNIGVEIGQLAIVLVFMPVAYLLRNGWFYQNVFFKFGSVSIAGMGCIWFVQRTLVS